MTTDFTFPVYKYFIVNTYDRPDERHIAIKRDDGKFYYVHPDLRDNKTYHGMTPSNPTPLEDFGIEWAEEEDMLFGTLCRKPTATYQDGRIRYWQDKPHFHFPLL